jgi:hypothetical protein
MVHDGIGAIFGISDIDAVLVVEFGHIFPPLQLIGLGEFLPKEMLPQLFVNDLDAV